MHPYQYFVWIVSAMLQAALVWTLWRRRLISEYPAFTMLCGLEVSSSITAFVLRHTSEAGYFYFYWASHLLSSVILIVVIQALLQQPLRELGVAAKMCNLLFYVVGMITTVSMVAAAVLNTAAEEFALVGGLVALDNGLRFVQAALLMLVAALAMRFSLRWKPLARSIARGTTILVGAQLLATSIRAAIGADANLFLRFFGPTSFLIGVAVWFFYICLAEPEKTEHRAARLQSFRETLEEIAR
jgi:hypothetical protein